MASILINDCLYGSTKENIKDIKKQARNDIQGTSINAEGVDGKINITRRGIDEWLNQPHKHYAEKNRMILYINDVFKNAIYLGKGIDKSTKPGSKFIHLYETQIQGDKSWIIVKEFEDGNKILYSISDSQNILKALK